MKILDTFGHLLEFYHKEKQKVRLTKRRICKVSIRMRIC